MGFVYAVPTIVAGTVLVVEQIESQNYVAGSSGWALMADGNAEVNDLTARGRYISGTGTGAHIEINGADAPLGVAFYTGEADETFPGVIQPNSDVSELSVTHSSPLVAGHTGASLVLTTGRSGADPDRLSGGAQTIEFSGTDVQLAGTSSLLLNSLAVATANIEINGETWHTVGAAGQPAFAGNWAIQGARPPAFYKDATGRVQLRGSAQEAVALSGFIFTLPAGYLPTQNMSWVVKCNNDATSVGWVTVATNGQVQCTGNFAGLRVQTILDGISFPTE